MKKINVYIISMAVALCGCFACDDEFMDRIPKTTVTAPGFFKSASDLQLYVNGIYEAMMPAGSFGDNGSDNVTIRTDEQPYTGLLYGRVSEDNISGWDGWDKLRRVNLMLNSIGDDIAGDEADINNCIGIARYFRARFYIDKVQTYSDVPWYDVVIESSDEELLFKAQDPRDVVVDRIMDDLEYAVANIKPDLGNRTRIHKYAALAELSRFALYEGTYRKYHPEINLASSANRFLERAVSASEEIMNSGQFEITGGGQVVEVAPGIAGSEGFRALFSSLNLDGNREIIVWADFDINFRRHRADDYTHSTAIKYSMSRSLQESFLTKDGRPFSTVPGYAAKTFNEVFTDRDPRMSETIIYPGLAEEQMDGSLVYQFTKPDRGGYFQCKFFYRKNESDAKTADGIGQFTGIPIFRLGEVLLNYAEAKAELGQLNQADIDKTINLLRARVGMPSFSAAAEVDQSLRDLYPGVTDANILAVRRERRVELASEGLRRHDMNRWYAGNLFEAAVSQQGIFVPGLPYVYDVTGDGVPDMGIAASESSKTGAVVTWYCLDDGDVTFYLDNGTSGYIRNKEDNLRRFEEPKYYYSPIPKSHTILNPNLKQPYGW